MRVLTSVRWRRTATMLAVSTLALTACASSEGSEFGVSRVEVSGGLVLEHEVLDTALAPGLSPLARLDLDGVPMASSEAVIGLAEADESSALSMAAISSDADASWQIATSPTCTAYVVTAADGVEIAVFLDARVASGESGQLTETVATAFRISDGEPLWGPVPVPGPPLADAGLVFYTQQDAPIADVSDATMIFDPATGEARLSAAAGELEIVGEFNGIGIVERLSGANRGLQALQLSDLSVLWDEAELPRPEGVSPDAEFAVAGMREAALQGILLGTWISADGTQERSAAYSLMDGALVTAFEGTFVGIAVAANNTIYFTQRSPASSVGSNGAAGQDTVLALHPEQGVLWEAPIPSGANLTAAGDGFLYLRLGGTGLVLDAGDGSVLADGDFRVPDHVFANGTVLISTAGELWLANRE